MQSMCLINLLGGTREQTRVESWEAEQRGSFEVGSGSGGSGSRVGGEAQSRPFSNVGDYFTHIPVEVPVPDQQQRSCKRGEHGDVGQPHSSQFRAEAEDEVDLLGDLRMERVMPSRGEANLDDDVDIQRLMLGLVARSQSMKEAPVITSSQPRRKGSHKQSAAPSQAAKGKTVATSQPTKGKGKDKGQTCGPAKGIVIREPPAPAQKKKSWFSWRSKKGKKMAAPVEDPLDLADLEILDPNAEETPSEDSPQLPSSRSHNSMTTSSPCRHPVGGGDGDGGGDGSNARDGGGGEGESGQEGGSGGGMVFTAEKRNGDHCTQDGDHGAPVQYYRRQKFVKGGRAKGSAMGSDS
ncbi:hypothetical protein Taro_019416 [Colocasia esculenta]|uniref:Uncharacterized protein n=1 Tax=Colocasia esculenta TaxID=4460 RepID=A0A843UL13_COLES|nr:hypothetical protein [Colocasia esculenta]